MDGLGVAGLLLLLRERIDRILASLDVAMRNPNKSILELYQTLKQARNTLGFLAQWNKQELGGTYASQVDLTALKGRLDQCQEFVGFGPNRHILFGRSRPQLLKNALSIEIHKILLFMYLSALRPNVKSSSFTYADTPSDKSHAKTLAGLSTQQSITASERGESNAASLFARLRGVRYRYSRAMSKAGQTKKPEDLRGLNQDLEDIWAELCFTIGFEKLLPMPIPFGDLLQYPNQNFNDAVINLLEPSSETFPRTDLLEDLQRKSSGDGFQRKPDARRESETTTFSQPTLLGSGTVDIMPSLTGRTLSTIPSLSGGTSSFLPDPIHAGKSSFALDRDPFNSANAPWPSSSQTSLVEMALPSSYADFRVVTDFDTFRQLSWRYFEHEVGKRYLECIGKDSLLTHHVTADAFPLKWHSSLPTSFEVQFLEPQELIYDRKPSRSGKYFGDVSYVFKSAHDAVRFQEALRNRQLLHTFEYKTVRSQPAGPVNERRGVFQIWGTYKSSFFHSIVFHQRAGRRTLEFPLEAFEVPRYKSSKENVVLLKNKRERETERWKSSFVASRSMTDGLENHFPESHSDSLLIEFEFKRDVQKFLDAFKGFSEQQPEFQHLATDSGRALELPSRTSNDERNTMVFEKSDRKLKSSSPALEDSPKASYISFKMHLPLRKFLARYYEDSSCANLHDVITITGSAANAQALTCEQYMEQTWPGLGPGVLGAVERALSVPDGTEYQCSIFGGVKFKCVINETSFNVVVTGEYYNLSMISKLLGWLVAALQFSPNDDKVVSAKPLIQSKPKFSLLAGRGIDEWGMESDISCQIKPLRENSLASDDSGRCWHALFQNAVVVEDYAISSRTNNEKGLEIPLDLMASLGNATYLTQFDGVSVLKGFSTMFVVTDAPKDSFVWHFLSDPDGNRLSYLSARKYRSSDNPPPHSGSISSASRHFLGWASSVKILAGTKDFQYNDIEWSKSKLCPSGYAFQKASLVAGNYITAGISLGPGTRNKRIVDIGKRSYFESAKFARRYVYVNMYDVRDRRGWLLDGASAALLLSRTQLSHPESPLSGNPHLDLQDFRYADGTGGGDAALAALTDEKNMMLIVDESPPEMTVETVRDERGATSTQVKTTTKRLLFHELVKRGLDLFEKMHDYQNMLMESESINLRATDRERLEGWDYLELVSGESSLKPRVEYLKATSRGWVDFTREIYAINLFGSGFGQMITPAEDMTDICDRWKQVPKKMDFLTTCVSTMDEICRKYGDSHSTPLSVANGVYWHKPDLLFEKCKCSAKKSTCDRAQVLLPRNVISSRKVRPEPFQHARGAVIFGRSKISSWKWPNQGPPTEDTSHDAEDAVEGSLSGRVRTLLDPNPSTSALWSSTSSQSSRDSRLSSPPPGSTAPSEGSSSGTAASSKLSGMAKAIQGFMKNASKRDQAEPS